ncbi:ornithine cyclodeaminase family protein [Roseovarius indicus]|jgi:ornithine cyclodeaminase|uniref:Alanine dehydrogenase n=1 Tax=Roseovarius indicus TaxID=540747 RepID=A0A0T5PBR2_9RHOB|nr:ornithine cyclodeaminase family protein [Roseovarius indicus]KRS18302.1 ornithine cyclodeaminase [Roseovarius indicus]QEW26858.1 alanine dehydrogenase [Roseovarius indicus]SFD58887.1 ornithine cyclodeaminase [Roseovarius indicus]
MSSPASTPPVYLDYLNRFDIEALGFTDAEILSAIEDSLRMQGKGETSIEPRMHIRPRAGVEGHFNVLRGWIGGEIDSAGTKVVGDFVDNYKSGRPSEYGLLTLFDPRMGAPKALIDATGITEMRTGAITALGAKYLAPEKPKVLGHIGARGTAYWNVRLLCHLFDFEEVRVHSRRPESQEAFAEQLRADLGREITVTNDWKSCLQDADIVVEASRLSEPQPLLKTEWIKPGALVVPYGTMSAVELNLTDIMDKVVMDDWGQAHGVFGALREHVDQGKLTAETLHAELGQIVAGVKPGRESAEETILFWHRGLSLSDIALGHAMLAKAKDMGVGQRLRFY